MSWFSKLSPAESEINNLYQQIIYSTTFKYFQSGNSDVLLEYKRFEAIMVAAAIYYSKIKHLTSKTELDTIFDETKKIYFKKTSPFLRKYILSGVLMFDLRHDKHITETDIIITVFAKFGRYVDDISFALTDHKPYFTEDWPGEYEGEVIERKIIFRFISNLFLSEIDLNYDNDQYIKIKDDWSIDNEEFILLERFAIEFL